MLTRAMAAAAGLVVVAIAAPAWAETAVVRSAVNVRAGPGPEHRIVGVLAQGRRIEIVACTQSRRWCQVATENGPGWIYTSYVSWSGGANVAVVQNPGLAAASPPAPQVQPDAVPTVAQPQADGAGTPPAAPAPEPARSASPGVVIPPDAVRSFVVTRPVDPVYLEGTVVVGAGLPEVVPLYPVPDYEYRYAFVNDQRVLVDGDRRIVYVFR
jgi:uncharacterized protein YraI